MSRHCSDDDLTLYYYGEGRGREATERHLEECGACAARYRQLADALALVTAPETPERGDQYGLEVWQRIRHQLPEPRGLERFARFAAFSRFAPYAAAAAVLVVAAFVAGQHFRPGAVNAVKPADRMNPARQTNRGAANAADSAAAKRILLTSVADHLNRSERVLTDVMNASDASDLSMEQGWAEDLLTASRLYRQDAVAAGEPSVADVLDELERSLLEIVHSPSRITNEDLEQIRRRIDAASLLFKVRVLESELRQRNITS